jgi:aspartate/methionine/tyrosine aminotransferase
MPDGGVVLYPRYTGPGDVERFAERLVQDAGIVILPASIYRSALGPTPVDRFRIGYGRANLAEGLAAMRAQLATMATTP